jgi:hypothetical protein
VYYLLMQACDYLLAVAHPLQTVARPLALLPGWAQWSASAMALVLAYLAP